MGGESSSDLGQAPHLEKQISRGVALLPARGTPLSAKGGRKQEPLLPVKTPLTRGPSRGQAVFFAKPLFEMKLLTLPDLFAIKFGRAQAATQLN